MKDPSLEPRKEIILVINPGSTSTKLGLWSGLERISIENIDHSSMEWATRLKTVAQLQERTKVAEDFLRRHGIRVEDLSCVVARGGLLLPVKSGAYLVNEEMVRDLREEVGGRHAANLGGLMAWEISRGRIPSYIVDPVAVDEYSSEARISGLPGLPRKSLLHALNMKACARRAAEELGSSLESLFLVIAHLGSGFSISPCYKGFLRDANNSNEEGPFTIERAGTLPALFLLEKAVDPGEGPAFKAKITASAGMYGYTGTKDARMVEARAKDDPRMDLVWRAMAYQVAKEICAMAAAYPERPDAVVLTGGLAKSAAFTEMIRSYTGFLGPHLVYPGEDEMEALAAGAIRVLHGQESLRHYPEQEALG